MGGYALWSPADTAHDSSAKVFNVSACYVTLPVRIALAGFLA